MECLTCFIINVLNKNKYVPNNNILVQKIIFCHMSYSAKIKSEVLLNLMKSLE